MGLAIATADALLLAKTILQAYDAFTVDELARIAAKQNFMEIAAACRKGIGSLQLNCNTRY
jgi:hypothetical protein